MESGSSRILQYSIEKSLGEFASLVRDDTGELKVIKKHKVIRSSEVTDRLKIVLERLKHMHIVDIEETILIGDTLHVVCEYCEGGSLHALINRAKQYEDHLNEMEVMDWFVQLTLSLSHLHSRGLAYGVLNPKNIFLWNNSVKISSSRLLFRELDRLAATDDWVASPNASNSLPYQCHDLTPLTPSTLFTSAGDVWSLGCILYELCSLRKLFPKTDVEQVDEHSLPETSQFFSTDIAGVWSKLMLKEEERPSVDAILKIPFVNSHRKEMDELEKQSVTVVKEDNSVFQHAAAAAEMSPSPFNSEDVEDEEYEDSKFLTEDDIRQLMESLERS